MHLNLSSPRLAVFNVMTLRWLCVCLQSAAVPAALLCFILVCLGGLGGLDVPTPTTSPDVTAGQTTTSGQAAKEAAQHSIKASTVLEDGVAQFLQRWPAVRLEHHNLKPSDMVHYNITCKPKVWLLLSSLYRSLKFVRPTMLDMLRRSAGDCWFVTLLVSSEKGTQREILEDDFQFFERRLGFLSVTRHGESKGISGKAYMYPVHWYGCWLIAHVIRESLPAVVGDPGSTVVLRHRPDECFRRCFDADAAGEVFAKWRYLILGQTISGDNGLTTNWATYSGIIAAGFIRSNATDPMFYMAALSSSWSSHEYCHGLVYPRECMGEIPYCRVNGNIPPCRPPIFISWQQHCLCRLNKDASRSFCIDKKPPDLPVETPCLQITKDAKCILPLAGAESLPPALRPPSHQLEGGVRKFKIEYMRPRKGYQECIKGRDLNETM
ncbi:unnamed protein product [Cladocopium goreaui]|uniref:Aminotransferase-like plant mobile domain-containing protein n=1 Tax=Cladocopium goreaui TaxID=2562237 RepID=A0A9P1DTK0_9DINO|nr:unnamed protein product [Cladocopium goreaui]